MCKCRSHGTFPLFGLQSSHLNICYYHQDLHRRPLRPGSRPGFYSDRRALLLIGAWHLPRRPGIGRALQRHPFSGLVDSADERFARQYRCGPPPEFPLASPRSGIVHHLSGPDRHALTRTLLRRSSYGQRPEEEKNFSERPCCHSRHHRTATVAAAFERPVIASAAEEPIRTGSDDCAAFVASTITPFLVELHLTDGDATIVSVRRFAAEIG
ncbi:hypothetical protein EZV62_027985 [Acer yangbiense]|uniref:Uncharacterized protein n=1 Tax=Acer yangbiense TaxID=1000413 RepID=A0A5C7GQJ7_9ROSI|nr:hypothetical protein EZV62_027985 [Acer yangbiense]